MYFGYHAEEFLPFVEKQEVVIPAGTWVTCYDPKPRCHRLKRRQTVVIDSFFHGRSLIHYMFNADNRNTHYQFSEWFALYDHALRTIGVNQFTKHKLNGVLRSFCIPLSNPAVQWRGEKGYWRSCDINYLVYGRAPPYPPPIDDMVDSILECLL